MMTWIWLLIFLLFFSCKAGASWVAANADDRVVFTSNAALAFADGDWTVAAWIRLPTNAGTSLKSFIANNTTTGLNPAFLINCYEVSHATTPGKISAVFNDDDGTDKIATSSTTPCNTTDTWMHILVKRESDVISMLVNGTSVSSLGADAAIDAHAAADWYFFTRPDLSNDRSGQLCDFGKWSRALTTKEITGLTQGASASSFLRGLEVWAPTTEFQERVAGLTVTATGATIGKCPRIFYPY